MGVTAVFALLMTILAYLAQSPRAIVRLGLAGQRLDLRVKLFTGYALASLILMLGFFLAGVPLGSPATVTEAPAASETTAAEPTSAVSESGAMGALPPTTEPTSLTTTGGDNLPVATNATQAPASGAFGGPPGSTDEITPEPATPSATPEQAGPSPTPANNAAETTAVPATTPTDDSTATPSPSPTATATPPPTATPSPTITPTPIEGITGTIRTNGSTLWVRRSPGGQEVVVVQNGEVVIVENGRANQGGILWREIRTVNGIIGWVQAEFLEEP